MHSIPRLLGLAAALLAGGCDNPLCVYAPDGCQDGGGGTGGIGSLPAGVPLTGASILPDDPRVDRVLPSGEGAHPSTPVVVVFTESIAPDSTEGSFELIESVLGVPVPFLEPPPVIGDGRLVVLSPVAPLELGTSYIVRVSDDAPLSDLTGQPPQIGSDRQVGSFTVAASEPATPRLVGSWPRDGTINQSDLSQIVAVFDRPMDPATFKTTSFVVTVGGGPPPVDPGPQALAFEAGTTQVTIPSVWHWTAVDEDGRRVSLGTDVDVEVTLSPAGNELTDEGGTVLPEDSFGFGSALFAAPDRARKATGSDPDDAIGRANLLDGAPVLDVELVEAANAGDELELFLVGPDRNGSGVLRALGRTVSISSPVPMVEVLPGQLDLLTSGLGRFADGTLHVACAIRRGGVRSAVRMVDVNDAEDGVQALLFDVTAPKLLGLGSSGSGTADFSSDLRDLVVVGRANERIREVRVSTAASDNGTRPASILADDAGNFVARPVPVGTGGVVDPADPEPYRVTILDRALNPAPEVSGTFRQVGGVTRAPLGSVVEVHVVDGATLAPLDGAWVFTHQDDAGVFTRLDAQQTVGGTAILPAGASGTTTLVTVDRTDYDLFTLHGVEGEVVFVPLRRTAQTSAQSEGVVTSPFPVVNFANFTKRIGDARRPETADRLYAVESCTVDTANQVFRCSYGPASILPRRLGTQSFLAYDPTLDLDQFTALGFLRGFAFRPALVPLGSGGLEEDVEIFVEELLLSADAEAQPIEAAQLTLDPAIDGDLGTSPTSAVTVEGVSPGLPGTVTVGAGLLYTTPDPWLVRSAYSGLAEGTTGGPDELVARGTIEEDLLVRAELAANGHRVGLRPRVTQIDFSVPATMPDVPLLLVPTPGGTVSGPSFEIQVEDVLDAFVLPGLARVQLSKAGGRRWVLWRPVPPGGSGGIVRLQVPDITPEGTPLAPGPIACRVSTYAWEAFDRQEFLWSDVERLHELFAHAADVTFQLQ